MSAPDGRLIGPISPNPAWAVGQRSWRLVTARDEKRGVEKVLEAVAEFEYPEKSGTIRIQLRRKRAPIASDLER